MKRSLMLFIFLVLAFAGRSQESISDSDPLQAQAVLVFPAPSAAQVSGLQAEFAKYPQIQSAVYVLQNHNCLLISFNTVSNPNFISYSDLTKVMSPYININDIKIKTNTAYTQIAKGGTVDTNIIIK